MLTLEILIHILICDMNSSRQKRKAKKSLLYTIQRDMKQVGCRGI